MNGRHVSSRAFEARLREYHGISVNDVLEIIAEYRKPGDGVIAGGSLVFGLGNRLSDLDLAVWAEDMDGAARMPGELFHGTLRIDFYRWTRAMVERVFERAERMLAESGPLGGEFGDAYDESDMKLVYRVAFGLVLDGHPLESSSSKPFGTTARALGAREYAERMRDGALLSRLALRAGKPVAALVNARAAVEQALHTELIRRDLPFVGDKWLADQAAREAVDVAEAYAPFAILPDDLGAAPEFVEAAMGICSEVVGTDVTGRVFNADAAWATDELHLVSVGGQPLLVSPRHGAQWELSVDQADAWRRLQDLGDPPWKCAELDEPEASLCFQLFERGLLRLRWDRGLVGAEQAPEKAAV